MKLDAPPQVPPRRVTAESPDLLELVQHDSNRRPSGLRQSIDRVQRLRERGSLFLERGRAQSDIEAGPDVAGGRVGGQREGQPEPFHEIADRVLPLASQGSS